ncbi:MAG: AraC family transcriptional regulator [Prolixibacteraceae bacterium]|jgi:AraC-like DNA-binding protein|nr:AraC family transcriptional regulator [Prolixibacteraceae bacterium]
MGWKENRDKKADPSTIEQHFTPIQPDVHCCRYWKLNEWEYTNMSFPFWRLYHNKVPGASVFYKEQYFDLTENNIIIIPPFTSFSTSLKKKRSEAISGNRIGSFKEIESLKEQGMVDHLFIHFNLGIHYDNVVPGLYNFNINTDTKQQITDIIKTTISSVQEFELTKSLQIYALISNLIKKIEPENWKGNTSDPRILTIIEHINSNFYNQITNEYLSNIVAMAPNSLLRLFRDKMGITIHQYIKQVRINKALVEMHNHERTIDDIAYYCGFSDRHHFSKVFKQITGMPPGLYRKKKIYR